MVLEDLTGRRFNYLTVICFAYKIVHGNNVIIKYNNISKTLSEWADYLGWNYCTLANRHKRGWSVERMLTEKPKYQKIR